MKMRSAISAGPPAPDRIAWVPRGPSPPIDGLRPLAGGRGMPDTSSQALQDLVDLLSGEGAHVVVVDLHHRRDLAGAQAFDPEEGHPAVRRRLAGLDSQPLLEVGDDVLGPEERAGEVVADREDVPADRPLVEERVEGDDLVDVGGREAEE